MKEIIAILLILTLISSVVLAASPLGMMKNPKVTNESKEDTGQTKGVMIKTTINESEVEISIINESEVEISIQVENRVKAKNVSELREIIQQKKQELNQTIQALREDKKMIYQNQNRVRLAVHSLLAMENLTGGIGKNVSQITKEFNNSIKATIRAEEKIKARHFLARLFMGGDEQAANEIEKEVNQNKIRIQRLKQYKELCNCTEEIRAMMQEQIQNIEQEQIRLQQLAKKEKEDKGLFRGLFAWFWR